MPDKKRGQWKPGQSGNPKGAPKRGQSWQELYKKIGNMTPKEAADYCRSIAGELEKIGNHITLKEAVVLRVYTALLSEPEPDARLLNIVGDREEGKVTQPVEITWRQQIINLGLDPEQVLADVESWLDEQNENTQ